VADFAYDGSSQTPGLAWKDPRGRRSSQSNGSMAQDDWVYLQQRQFHVESLGTDRVRRQQPCSRRALAEYRGGDYKRVLGNAIRSGYRELYETYSDAHARSVTELDSFFSTHTSAGKSVRELTVRAFRTLAGIADFAGTTDDSVPVATEEAKTGDSDSRTTTVRRRDNQYQCSASPPSSDI